MSGTVEGFDPDPPGNRMHSADVLLEAILEQTRLGRTVSFDDDIGPDLGIQLEKRVVNLSLPRRFPRRWYNRDAIRLLSIKHWVNDSDYAERMRRRNSPEAVAEMIREMGRELDAEIAEWEAKGWKP